MSRNVKMPENIRSTAKEKLTYDTPIPDELRPAYESWYGQLPKNLQYTGDYDLQGAWLERLGRPTKYEATQNGHLDDYGKKPNHPTFSSGSKWHDPKIPERTGGEWKKATDGSWDFYPGTGNVLIDGQLKDYFDKYEKGSRVHPRNVRQAAKAGDAGAAPSKGVPSGHNAALGGFTVKGGKVTDTFDINRKYDTVPQALTNVARAVLGKQEDPDAGKVRTEIPLDKIPGVQSASKGGDVLGNFLATDDVPETLFGFPVVTKDYTPEDLAFFKAHPEAGGYYYVDDETEGVK